MRRLRRRAAGPPHDAEGGGGDEQQRLRREHCDAAAAGLRQGQAAAVQVPSRDQVHRRIAEDWNEQDRPASRDADVTVRRAGKLAVVPAKAGTHNHKRLLLAALSAPAVAKTTACGYGSRIALGFASLVRDDSGVISAPTPSAPCRHRARRDRRTNPPTTSRP